MKYTHAHTHTHTHTHTQVACKPAAQTALGPLAGHGLGGREHGAPGPLPLCGGCLRTNFLKWYAPTLHLLSTTDTLFCCDTLSKHQASFLLRSSSGKAR
eukprot:scaffold19805_cov21-Tisochrysis_lutea.AAC.1